MKKIHMIILLSAALWLPVPVSAQDTGDMQWSRTVMDGSRTGVTVPASTDVEKALGAVKGNTYYAPSGKVFKGGTVARVAEAVIEAQPAMAPVKKVIGYSPEAMASEYPESPLSNWFADNLMRATEDACGRHVDMSIANFGGIRVDMPQGDVTVDDIRSMFPFKNDLVYLSMTGKEIRHVLEWMAEEGFQVLGGVRVVAEDGELLSAEIGGRPLDDNAVYGVATISFLLHGGDGLYLADGAEEVVDIPVDIYTAMVRIVGEDAAAGKPITGAADGRVTIIDDKGGE